MLSTEGVYRALIEAAPDAIIGVDDVGIIKLVNAQTERLFGYPRAELLGASVDILVPDAARHVHPLRRATYSNNPQPRPMGAGMELAGRRRDGSEFPAEISLSVISTDKGMLYSAAVRDVSERIEAQAERERLRADAQRERLESRLHQSQRLESLGQLAGGVAHDFNNLLGAILNYATFVADELDSRAESDASLVTMRDDVAQIRRCAERGAELTRQLLTFGRREIVQPQILNINDVVRSVQQLLRRTIGEHVELSTVLSPNVEPVTVDPGQLEQVLVNLAINARDAMASGGTLIIDTQMVDVDEVYAQRHPGMSPGRFTQLRVNDNGVGMTADVIEHAFEPFFTTKPKGEGTGLGLATVYGILSQAGGFVNVYSEVGRGTTVQTLWPVTTSEVSADLGGPPVAFDGGGESVLVVEDEAAMRDVTSRILTSHGYQVVVAASGHEALAMVSDSNLHVDVLLTDVIMPQMLGKEVAERLTAMRPALRTLFMSGYAQPILASQGTLDPGVALLEKPFTTEGLLAKVRQVLDVPGGALAADGAVSP